MILKLIAISIAVMSVAAFSEPQGQGNGPGAGQPKQGAQGGMGKRRPPKEAMEACKGKASGASCTFTGKKGSVTGTCWAPKQGMPLACKPQNMGNDQGPQGGGEGGNDMPPPPELNGSGSGD